MKELLYVPDIAKVLDTTETAVRKHVQRRTDAIPPFFKRGRRVAWRRQDVERWLATREIVQQYPTASS